MTEERVKSFQFRHDMAAMLETAMARPVVIVRRAAPLMVVVSHDEYMRVRDFMYMSQQQPKTEQQ